MFAQKKECKIKFDYMHKTDEGNKEAGSGIPHWSKDFHLEKRPRTKKGSGDLES